MAKVLIADDERSICEAFAALVEAEGHAPLLASSGEEALQVIATEHPDAVFLDVRMPGMDGLETLAAIRREDAELPVIVMTAYGTLQTAATAMRQNAFDYLGKPLELDAARRVLRRALHRRLVDGAAPPDAAPASGAGTRPADSARGTLVGQSAAMQEIFKLIVLLSSNELTALIEGESGVGKELVARAIHASGPRSTQPFVAVNCAAIPEALIESELFGHERGAFTDAREGRAGRFEAAGRGTLFLDEISEMPLHLQSKLLRVLQERTFERVGSVAPHAFHGRLIAATNHDLAAAVRAGRFREDLYHRLHLVPIRVPPLRERREDIPSLVQTFLARANEETGRRVTGIEPAALERLQRHDWPGNVRELENVIKRAVLLSRTDTLAVHDLPFEPAPATGAAASDAVATFRTIAARLVADAGASGAPDAFDAAVGALERALVEAALQATGGNRAAAAKLLGISRVTLRNKIPSVGETDE